jgi:tetratricopeptide (TPR) repeat protein
VPPEARDALDAMMETPGSDGPISNLEKLEALIREYPDFVEAHRQLQNMYLLDYRHGYLMNTYRELKEQNPGKAEYHYLYGRLFTQPERQLDLFEESVDIDPGFFWGYNGLGYAFLMQGNGHAAEAAYQAAIQSAPRQVEPYIGLANLYFSRGDHEEAGGILTRGLELFPEDLSLLLLKYKHKAETESPQAAIEVMVNIPSSVRLNSDYFAFLLQMMQRASNENLLRKVLYRFGTLDVGNGDLRAPRDLVLGLCCKKLGDLHGAARYFSRVLEEFPDNPRARREMRFLHVAALRLRDAYELATADCPAAWIDGSRLGASSFRLFELEDLLAGKSNLQEHGAEFLDLGTLLMGLGWLDEAAYHLNRIAGTPGEWGEKAEASLQEIYRHNLFELTMREFFLKQYREFRIHGRTMDLEDAAEALGKVSSECLGRDIFENLSYIDLSPVGRLLDPRISAVSGPRAYFSRYNRFFLMGRKMGGPVEAYLMDIFGERPESMQEIGEQEIVFDLFRCENLRIPSFIEFEGGNIVGAALYRFIFMNLDAIRQEAYQVRRLYERRHPEGEKLLADPPPRATTDEERLSVDEQLGLPARLNYLSFVKEGAGRDPADYMENRFDAVFIHELQHLADAHQFLPMMENLFGNLYRFIIMGFSPFRVESWLEERAQLYALHKSRDPYANLADIAEHLRNTAYLSPHASGYKRLMERIVAFIHDHPDRFAAIDRNANLLHQLHRLSPEEILEIAAALAEDEEIG